MTVRVQKREQILNASTWIQTPKLHKSVSLRPVTMSLDSRNGDRMGRRV